MATKTFNTRIANKRDTSANWTSNNPVLLNGEVIIVDTEAGQVRYKVGNGTSTYTQLPFTDESLITNINGKLSLSGGTMTGNIDMGGHKLTGLGAPVNPNDAVRQADLKVVSDEVDGIISGTTGITLAPATTTKIGGVKIGDGVEVAEDGTISVTPGLTQEQADERYLKLTGGTANQDFSFSYGTQDKYGAKIALTERDGIVTSKLATNNDLYQVGVSEEGVKIGSETPEIDVYGPGFVSLTGNVLFYDPVDRTEYLFINPSYEGAPTIRFNSAPGAIGNLASPTYDSDAANKAYVDSKAPTYQVIALSSSAWASNSQTVTVGGVTADELAQLIAPTPAIASQSAYYEAGIMCTGQAANSLTFTCQTVPTSNLTVYVVIQPLG